MAWSLEWERNARRDIVCGVLVHTWRKLVLCEVQAEKQTWGVTVFDLSLFYVKFRVRCKHEDWQCLRVYLVHTWRKFVFMWSLEWETNIESDITIFMLIPGWSLVYVKFAVRNKHEEWYGWRFSSTIVGVFVFVFVWSKTEKSWKDMKSAIPCTYSASLLVGFCDWGQETKDKLV